MYMQRDGIGLGLWGRCVSYVCENCVLYAPQPISYHMYVKTAYYMHALLCYDILKRLILFLNNLGKLFFYLFILDGLNYYVLHLNSSSDTMPLLCTYMFLHCSYIYSFKFLYIFTSVINFCYYIHDYTVDSFLTP